MKRLIGIFFLISLMVSCNDNAYQKPNDPLEAGRDFIRFALDGDMKMAKTFILHEPDNDRLFDKYMAKYQNTTQEEKVEYHKSNIIVHKVDPINDSTTIIRYANSYKKQENEIKLLKIDGEWWVDFKHTFTHSDEE